MAQTLTPTTNRSELVDRLLKIEECAEDTDFYQFDHHVDLARAIGASIHVVPSWRGPWLSRWVNGR